MGDFIQVQRKRRVPKDKRQGVNKYTPEALKEHYVNMVRKYKTEMCRNSWENSLPLCPNGKRCFDAHTERERRRDPLRGKGDFVYSRVLCESRTNCISGRSCSKAHNESEAMYHPLIYKTKLCSNGDSCDRGDFCAFMHKKDVLKPQVRMELFLKDEEAQTPNHPPQSPQSRMHAEDATGSETKQTSPTQEHSKNKSSSGTDTYHADNVASPTHRIGEQASESNQAVDPQREKDSAGKAWPNGQSTAKLIGASNTFNTERDSHADAKERQDNNVSSSTVSTKEQDQQAQQAAQTPTAAHSQGIPSLASLDTQAEATSTNYLLESIVPGLSELQEQTAQLGAPGITPNDLSFGTAPTQSQAPVPPSPAPIVSGGVGGMFDTLHTLQSQEFSVDQSNGMTNGATPQATTPSNTSNAQPLRIDQGRSNSASIVVQFLGEAAKFGNGLQRALLDVLGGSPEGSRATDGHGTTALLHAIHAGHRDLIRALANPQTINAANSFGQTPLSLVIDRDDADTLRQLVDLQVSLTPMGNGMAEGPLLRAIKQNAANCAMLLASYKQVDVSLRDANLDTALLLAASKGTDQLVHLICQRAPDQVNVANAKGETPLYKAVQQGHLNTTNALLLNQADPKKADANGVTPLDIALSSENPNSVACGKLLMQMPQLDSKAATSPEEQSLPSGGSESFLSQDPVCAACNERKATIRLQPCGHVSLCNTCLKPWFEITRSCPLCRVKVTMFPQQ